MVRFFSYRRYTQMLSGGNLLPGLDENAILQVCKLKFLPFSNVSSVERFFSYLKALIVVIRLEMT